MNHKTFILAGRIPSKKNNKIVIRGKAIPSNKYRKWHRKASYQLISQGSLHLKMKVVVGIEIIFFFPDNRKKDMTNCAESIMDLLVDRRVIKDDSWQHIFSLQLYAMGIDKKNPRAEVTIKYR